MSGPTASTAAAEPASSVAPSGGKGTTIIGGGGGGSNRPASCGAMALLDKYSTLNANIEEAQTQTAEIREEVETARQSIDSLLEERRDMIQRTRRSQEEYSEMGTRLGEATVRCDALGRERDGTARDAASAVREYDAAVRFAEEGRSAFLARCGEFRAACKRIRLEALASESASSAGSASASASYRCGGVGGLLLLSAPSDDEDDCPRECRRGRPKATRKVDDAEMDEAEAKARDGLDARDVARAGLDDARSDRDEAARRGADRTRRLEQQRAQLDRVRMDVEEMERELSMLDQETKEFRDVGDGLARAAASRKRNARQNPPAASSFSASFNAPPEMTQPQQKGTSDYTPPTARRSTLITPSPYVSGSNDANAPVRSMVNPYSKSGRQQGPQSIAAAAPAPLAGNDRGGGGGYARVGVGVSTLERQHPHRAGGRIRVDRRFSTALEIISGQEQPDHHDLPDDDDGPDRSAGPSSSSYLPPGGGGGTGNRRSLEEWNSRTKSLLEEDDDDDDDDILSFVAFGKK